MIIRKLDIEKDALAVTEGALEFAKRASLGKYISGGKDFIDAVSRIVTLEQVSVLVAEYKGKVVGGIGISYLPYIWEPTITVAEELFWFASESAPYKTGTLLLKKAMEDIDGRGAVPMFKKLSTSPAGVDKMYRKYGMFPIESLYMRRI